MKTEGLYISNHKCKGKGGRMGRGDDECNRVIGLITSMFVEVSEGLAYSADRD
jgi:hypothetical protein